ncbi:thioesterase family protein [Paracoccus sp. MA]|uniref:thioesterase family protein n=1 Tax=Paracoccus sp. MA TaxID=2895796 RepID=UPI001E3EA344|nr:thioesterase family protein [Paracoccus sp. MA]UFM66403.1 thioesterase family protein [Paracoccus sp. MA]
MKPGLTPGARARFSMTVAEGDTVRALFSDRGAFPRMPAVFATAKMVGLMEWACVEQLRPYYEEGEDSLGVHVDVDHSAPTLPGQAVTVETEVEEIDGRFIWFKVVAHDGIDRIGAGRHRRALINTAKFNDRLEAKRAKAGLEG